MKTTKEKLSTKEKITWCPGCPNFMILESLKIALEKLIEKGEKQESFAISTDIGCNSKIFDYVNLSGIYGLHGRAIPTALGIKMGNPRLNVIAIAGDGGTYSEGIEHFIHTLRYNSNMTILVHDNQSFSLTTGQSTPTTQEGYKSKANPRGEMHNPINPLKIAISSNATFIARANAKDIKQTAEIIEKAIRHQGTSFVEIIQDCLIFNKESKNRDKLIYKIKDNKDKKKAEKMIDEWDYNSKKGKIATGIIYQVREKTLEEKMR